MKLKLICVFATFLCASCTKRQSNSLEFGLDISETLRVNLQNEPPSLDWTKSKDITSTMVEVNIMDGLVELDQKDPQLGPVPALAKGWKTSSDFKKWTFEIRKGVRWTDGVDFSAQQVVDGWERVLNPKTGSEYAYFLYSIKNAKAYNKGTIKSFDEVGAKVDKEGNLEVQLEQPLSFLPLLLSQHATFPVRKDLIEKFGEHWIDPANLQTLGAYKLKAWEHDKALIFERNESYYGKKPQIKNVLGYIVNEFSTALNLFDSGKLDFQPELPAKELSLLKKKPGFRSINGLEIYFLGFNQKLKPFNDVRVRKAFAHAVDKKQITDMLATGVRPISGWLPPGTLGYNQDIGIKFDPSRANKLLDEAGYKDRSLFPKTILAFNTNENHQRVAEAIQAQLKRNIGVEIELLNQEWKIYLRNLRAETPSIYRLGWVADYSDPSAFMDMMTSFSDNNYTGWSNSKYDELVSRAAGVQGKMQRQSHYEEAQRLLTEKEAVVLPIYAGTKNILLSERVKEFPLNPIQRWTFKDATF